ncbi:MAG: DUF2207 domain-containing protein, partial [Candidatus Eisenbacteria bacterium]
MAQRSWWWLAVGLALLAAPLRAEERILSFRAGLIVDSLGVVTVAETLQVRSEQWLIDHGIYRDLLRSSRDRSGRTRTWSYRIIAAERAGVAEPYHVEQARGVVRVYIGDPERRLPAGTHEYVLRYVAVSDLRSSVLRSELYWNVTGNHWEFPIDSTHATVTLPRSAVSGGVRAWSYEGLRGEQEPGEAATGRPSTSTIELQAARPLRAHEGFTILLEWRPPPTAAVPATWADLTAQPVSVYLGLDLLLALLIHFVAWWSVGRDAGERGPALSGGPPAGISPALARVVWRLGVDDKSFRALIVHMLYQGLLQMDVTADGWMMQRRAGSAEREHGASDEERLVMNELRSKGGLALHPRNAATLRALRSRVSDVLTAAAMPAFYDRRRGPVFGVCLVAGFGLVLSGLECFAQGIGLGWGVLVAGVVIGLPRSMGGRVVFRLPRDAWDGTTVTVMGILAIGGFAWLFVTAYTQLDPWPLTFAPLLAGTMVWSRHVLKARTARGREIDVSLRAYREALTGEDMGARARALPRAESRQLFAQGLAWAMALDAELPWVEIFAPVLDGNEPDWLVRGETAAGSTPPVPIAGHRIGFVLDTVLSPAMVHFDGTVTNLH